MSTKHKEEYENDGFTILRGVLDRSLVTEMQDHVKWLQQKFPDIPGEHLHHPLMRNDPFWVRVCAEDRLLDAAQGIAPDFLADGVSLFSSHYFVKAPRTGKAVLWHTDNTYWPLDPMDVLTLWVCVGEAGSHRENGCLRVVKGSHQWESRELRKDFGGENVLGSRTHDDDEIDESLVVDLELEPGDVSVHDPRIVHGSEPNTSNSPRIGLTIRYMSNHTNVLSPEQPVLMLRGESSGKGSFKSWPKYRSGYDFPFHGAERWNAMRRIVPDDEPFFQRTDYAAIDKEVEREVWEVIHSLQEG